MMKFKSAVVESTKEFFNDKIATPVSRTYKRIRSDEFKTNLKHSVKTGFSVIVKYTKSFLSAFKKQTIETFVDVATGVLKFTRLAVRFLVIAMLASLAISLLKPFAGMVFTAFLYTALFHIVLSILNNACIKMIASQITEEMIPATVTETEAE